MSARSPTERASEYGPLGPSLLELLPRFSEVTELDGLDTAGKLLTLQKLSPALAARHPLLPAAVSLLVLPFPLQLPNPDRLAAAILSFACPVPLIRGSAKSARLLRTLTHHSPEWKKDTPLRRYFPLKGFAAASSRNSISLRRYLKSTVREYGSASVAPLLAYPPGTFTDDQACAALLHGSVLSSMVGPTGFAVSARLVAEPALAKGISNAMKALGCNSSPLGAALTESQSLQGRGVAPADLAAEVKYRCDPDLVKEKVLPVDAELLREHIRSVIVSELPEPPEIEERESWWSRRWLWCVNGTENSLSDAALKLDSSAWKRTHTRAYRKMAAEGVVADPTLDWDGVTLVSVSPKLEHGKTRTIFACDTLSYFAFARVLDPVQKAWRNNRVLLDPGAGGMYGISRRIRRMRSRGGVNLMLDFDDFNSHHSTESMIIIFDELCRHMGCPDSVRLPLMESFNRTYIQYGGKIQRALGTLMSGHRGTTIVNSILNAAYIRYAVGGPAFDNMDSLHTGDDVYVCANTLTDCTNILDNCRAVGCRMNPSKQSVGYTTAEFLRCAITDQFSRGYVSRSIASLTCGSWVSPNALPVLEGLRNLVTTVRSCINRSSSARFVKALAPATTSAFAFKHLPKGTLYGVLVGEISLDNGPVFGGNGQFKILELSAPPPEPPDRDNLAHLPAHASTAYLAKHVSRVEATALQLVGADPLPMLKTQSYTKGLVEQKELGSDRPRLVLSGPYHARGRVDVSELLDASPSPGVLTRFPLLQFVADRLTKTDLRTLVALAGGDPGADDIRVEAFGADRLCHRIVGSLPYSDAAFFSGRTFDQNIYTQTPVYM